MPRLACPSWRWMTTMGTPSCAISTACACRTWCGANRRRTPAIAAVRRSCLRAAEGFPVTAGGRAADDAQQDANGQLGADLEPRLELIPRPSIHTHLAATVALAAA